MKYIKDIKGYNTTNDMEEYGVVVADTDTDSLILYSDNQWDKDERVTEIRPTSMLTEDIAGYFPSHTLNCDVQPTFVIVHPDDLMKHIKQYMVFPEDKGWLIKYMQTTYGDTEGDLYETVVNTCLCCSPIILDSSEMGILVSLGNSDDNVTVLHAVIRFKTDSGVFRFCLIDLKYFSDLAVNCELINGGLMINEINDSGESEYSIFIQRVDDKVVVSEEPDSDTFITYSYNSYLDIIETEYTDPNFKPKHLPYTIFDVGSNMYIRPFDDTHMQFATLLDTLEQQICCFSKLKAEQVPSEINSTPVVNGYYTGLISYDNLIYDGLTDLIYADLGTVLKPTSARYCLKGDKMVQDSHSDWEYPLKDVEPLLMMKKDKLSLKEGYSLEDYDKIISKLVHFDIDNSDDDTQLQRNIRNRLIFLGVSLKFDNSSDIRLPLPSIIADMIDISAIENPCLYLEQLYKGGFKDGYRPYITNDKGRGEYGFKAVNMGDAYLNKIPSDSYAVDALREYTTIPVYDFVHDKKEVGVLIANILDKELRK